MDTPNFAGPHHLREGKMPQSGVGTVAYGSDDEASGFQVTFYEDALFMEALSQDAGHPIYRTQIMTLMVAPGNNKTTWVHATTGIKYELGVDPESGEPVTHWEVMEQCENGDVPEPVKYPKAWQRFKTKNAAALDGFPIEEWGIVSKTYAQSLKAYNIHTVEALAHLSDANAQNIMGGIKYRDLAKAALSERAHTKLLSKEQEVARRANEKAEALERQVSQLTETVNKLLAEREGDQRSISHDLPETPARREATRQVKPQLKKLSSDRGKALQARQQARKTGRLEVPEGATSPDTEEEAA